jgi:PAS domain-containing protein
LGIVWLFIEPRHSFTITHLSAGVGLALFIIVGVAISLLLDHLRESLLSRARAEAVLRQHAHLIDLSHDAIITMDAHRVITGWNAGAEELYGWTETETVGNILHDLLTTKESHTACRN